MLPGSVIEAGERLARALYDGNFSRMLADLVREASKQQASGEGKNPEQYLTEMVGLLAEKRALKAKLKEKEERFKLERKGLIEALALAEEELKRARSSAT